MLLETYSSTCLKDFHYFFQMEDFHFQDGCDEYKHNPWSVKSIEDFRFYCCPECERREVNKKDFLNHAINNHPRAIDSLNFGGKSKPHDEVDSNLWNVESIESFRFYCCPELCPSREVNKSRFLRHAHDHRNSQKFLESLEVGGTSSRCSRASSPQRQNPERVNPEPVASTSNENARETTSTAEEEQSQTANNPQGAHVPSTKAGPEPSTSKSTEEKLLKCEYCVDNIRYSPAELRVHEIANHSGEIKAAFKLIKCENCKNYFNQAQLKDHHCSSCNTCGQELFRKWRAKNRHRANCKKFFKYFTTTTNSCSLCGKVFVELKSFFLHMKKKHKNYPKEDNFVTGS